MKLEKLKQIYSLKGEIADKVVQHFGLGDTVAKDQVLVIDEFLEWKGSEKLKIDDALSKWEDYKKATSEQTIDFTDIEVLATQLAEQQVSQLPQLAAEQNAEMRHAFIMAYRKRTVELLSSPDFKAKINIFLETGDLGKLQESLSSQKLLGGS